MSMDAPARLHLSREALAMLVKAASDPELRARMEKQAAPLAWLARQAGQGAGAIGRGLGLMGRSAPAAAPKAPGLQLGEIPQFMTQSRMPRPSRMSMPPGASSGPLGSPPPGLVPPGAAEGAPAGWGRFARRGLGIGAGGTGVAALGHAGMEQAENSPDYKWYNPGTWNDRPQLEDVFKKNLGKYNELDQAMGGRIAESEGASPLSQAFGFGGPAETARLKAQRESGDFRTGDNALVRGLQSINPFGDSRAGVYRDRALTAQRRLQSERDTELGKSGPAPGSSDRIKAIEAKLKTNDLLPSQASGLEDEMKTLRSRLGGTPGAETPQSRAIQQRMQAAGMRVMPFAGPGGGGSETPVGNYAVGQLGRRPGTPGYATGYAHNPSDLGQPEDWADKQIRDRFYGH